MTGVPPTFTAKQVCAAIDVPHGTLNSWAHAGYFKQFDAAETTPGKAREFTLEDLCRLAVLKLLLDFGFTGRKAKEFANIAIRYMDMYTPRKIKIVLGREEEEFLVDDQEATQGSLLELNIYPWAITAALRERLGLPSAVPQSVPHSENTPPSEVGP